MGNGVYTSLKGWLNQPFSDDMDTTQWFLFGGLVVVIALTWFMILRDLKGAIE